MASNEPTSTRETSDRVDYLVECLRSGHEELMYRVSHRDNWLKIQMLAQAALLALASGVEVVGVKASTKIPTVLALAIPTALTLSCLYVVEDRLIGLISRYIGRLSDLEAKLTESTSVIEYVGASPEIREYAFTTLPFRVLAQFVAFSLVPAILATYRFAELSELRWYNCVEFVIDCICLILTLWLLHCAYEERKQSGRAKSSPTS